MNLNFGVIADDFDTVDGRASQMPSYVEIVDMPANPRNLASAPSYINRSVSLDSTGGTSGYDTPASATFSMYLTCTTTALGPDTAPTPPPDYEELMSSAPANVYEGVDQTKES